MWKSRLAQIEKGTDLDEAVSSFLYFMHHGLDHLESSKVFRFSSVLVLIHSCEMQRDSQFPTMSTTI
jgi:hypothetical protein